MIRRGARVPAAGHTQEQVRSTAPRGPQPLLRDPAAQRSARGLGTLCSCFISPEQDSLTNLSLQAARAEELRIHGAMVQLRLSVCPISAAAWLLHRPVPSTLPSPAAG